MEKTNFITFLDSVGRTIIGERISETSSTVNIQNPVVVHVVPQEEVDQQTGQRIQRLALQLYPLFFREFLADKTESIVWTYPKNMIALPVKPVVFDFKLEAQYRQLFMNIPVEVPAASQPVVPGNTIPTENSAGGIKLFDD